MIKSVFVSFCLCISALQSLAGEAPMPENVHSFLGERLELVHISTNLAPLALKLKNLQPFKATCKYEDLKSRTQISESRLGYRHGILLGYSNSVCPDMFTNGLLIQPFKNDKEYLKITLLTWDGHTGSIFQEANMELIAMAEVVVKCKVETYDGFLWMKRKYLNCESANKKAILKFKVK